MFKKVLLLAVLICLTTSSLAVETPAIRLSLNYQPTDTLLILGAVPQEIVVLTDALEDAEKGELWGIPYWQGKLAGKSVVIAITGVGKTYTGMTTTLFLNHVKPKMVLMTGTGARINQALRTGDVVIAATTNFHDFGSLGPDGMDFRAMKSPVDGAQVQNKFEADEALVLVAEAAAKDYKRSTITIGDNTYQNNVMTGMVSTSDLFGVTNRRITTLRDEFGTDIMEMESAAFALVCQSFGVPYLIIRSGSNVAQETPNNDYLTLSPIAAREAAMFTLHLIKYL